MTKTLVLMRHAKSSWATPDQSDHARPLNARGRTSAKAMGDWLRQKNYAPDQVLSSSSQRTRDTFDGLGIKAPARFIDDLYHADPETMVRILAQATGDCVLMLGHNPGIAEFAALLVRTLPDHPRFRDYPTCATLVVRFDIDGWSALEPHNGAVLDFVIPRELSAK